MPALSRGHARPCDAADLQDFAVFHRHWRAFERIEPTGKGSEPLPVIDFKRNLQFRYGFHAGSSLSVRPGTGLMTILLTGFAADSPLSICMSGQFLS